LIGGPDAAIGWGLGEEGGKGPGNGAPPVQDFEGGLIFRDSDGTIRAMVYVFFDDADTFVRVPSSTLEPKFRCAVIARSQRRSNLLLC
jgi:hypothetical protein